GSYDGRNDVDKAVVDGATVATGGSGNARGPPAGGRVRAGGARLLALLGARERRPCLQLDARLLKLLLQLLHRAFEAATDGELVLTGLEREFAYVGFAEYIKKAFDISYLHASAPSRRAAS